MPFWIDEIGSVLENTEPRTQPLCDMQHTIYFGKVCAFLFALHRRKSVVKTYFRTRASSKGRKINAYAARVDTRLLVNNKLKRFKNLLSPYIAMFSSCFNEIFRTKIF